VRGERHSQRRAIEDRLPAHWKPRGNIGWGGSQRTSLRPKPSEASGSDRTSEIPGLVVAARINGGDMSQSKCQSAKGQMKSSSEPARSSRACRIIGRLDLGHQSDELKSIAISCADRRDHHLAMRRHPPDHAGAATGSASTRHAAPHVDARVARIASSRKKLAGNRRMDAVAGDRGAGPALLKRLAPSARRKSLTAGRLSSCVTP